MNYEQMMDDVLTFYSEGTYAEEVVKARAVFFDHVGVMDEESYDYEMKMTQFSEWYLFSRKLSGQDRTPIEKAGSEFSMIKEYPKIYESLLNHRHSLFEFLKLSKNDLYIRDLISNYKFVVKNSPVTVGFNKGEFFEARLIPHEDSFLFTRSFCFHPPQAGKYIKKEIKQLAQCDEEQIVERREAVLLKLFRMKNKLDQYRHINIDLVYSQS